MAAPWWPRGLGLQVDDHAERFQYEPPEGVRDWIRVRRGNWDGSNPDWLGWSADAGYEYVTVVPCLDEREFCSALLRELRVQTSGLSSRAGRNFPADGWALRMEVRARTTPPDVRCTRLPLPPVGAWAPGEVLSQPRATKLTGPDASASRQTVRAEVAALLGATLLHRFDWHDPVALAMEPFERLEAERSLKPEAALAWSLAVSSSGEDIELILHEGKSQRPLGIVLPRGVHQQGTYFFRPSISDSLERQWEDDANLINGDCRRLGRVMVPVGAVDVSVDKPLAGIDPKGRLMVTGHGSVRRVPGRPPYADALGGLGPDALASDLLAEGLPKDFAGSIHLSSCHTGGAPGNSASYAHRLQEALAKRGFRGVTVAASPGVTRGSHRMRQVLPDHLVHGTGRTIRASEALIRNLEREGRRTDVDDEHRVACAKVITEERDHVDRIKALNWPRVNGRENPPRRREAGKLQGLWNRLNNALGLRYTHMEPWSPKDLQLEEQAKVRRVLGRIGPRSL